MLHARRKRLKEYAEREAAGENLWRPDFPSEVRTKISYAVTLAAHHLEKDPIWAMACTLILVDEGWARLNDERTRATQMLRFLKDSDEEMVPSAVEALWRSLDTKHPMEHASYVQQEGDVALFERQVNEAFTEHRIAWELVNGEMVDFESKELHQEVVAPTLRLLSGRPGWAEVEKTYQKALREIHEDPGDAITDAGSALQAALTLLGCEGNALGPLAKSARQKGLFAPHDSTLMEGIEKILHWVSADRSEMGDAHPGGEPRPEDAWLAVHVVGALILRTAQGPRG